MSDLELKILDPLTDAELFRESWNWRPSPKKHVGTNRAPFDAYISTDPRQIVVGVFNGSFIASFVLYEWEPTKYECHVTSKRGLPKATLIQAGEMVRDAFFNNGATELCAWIVERNRPLRRFVEQLGFTEQERRVIPTQLSACVQDDGSLNSVSVERTFVKYAKRA